MKNKLLVFLFTILLIWSCRKEKEETPCKESITYSTFNVKLLEKKTGKTIGLDLLDSLHFYYIDRYYTYDFRREDTNFYFYMFKGGNDTIFLKLGNAERYDTLVPIYEILRDKCNNPIQKFYNLYHNGELVKDNSVKL